MPCRATTSLHLWQGHASPRRQQQAYTYGKGIHCHCASLQKPVRRPFQSAPMCFGSAEARSSPSQPDSCGCKCAPSQLRRSRPRPECRAKTHWLATTSLHKWHTHSRHPCHLGSKLGFHTAISQLNRRSKRVLQTQRGSQLSRSRGDRNASPLGGAPRTRTSQPSMTSQN